MHELDSELCTLMKEKAPAGDVQEKFDELYPNKRGQSYDLFVCYVVHYDYHDVDIDIELLMHESEFSPFLTAAHERKPDFFSQEKLYVMNYRAVFCKIFTAAYGIFQNDIMQTDCKMIITDILLPRDDMSYLYPYLQYGARPELPMLVHAARYGAKHCCERLALPASRYRDMDFVDPNALLDFFLHELGYICDITVENSLCVFKFISRKFQHLSFPRLNENDKEKIRRFNDDIDMIIDALKSSSDIATLRNRFQSVALGCDLELFSRVFLQSCESLLQVLKQQSSEPTVIPMSLQSAYNIFILPSYAKVMPQERLLCSIKLLTKVTKLMLQNGVQPPKQKFQCKHFTMYDSIISVIEKDVISTRIVDLFRVQLVYGWIQLKDDCDWQWLKPNTIVTEYPDCMVKAIQEGIGLLPREIYDRLRNNIMMELNELEQELKESSDDNDDDDDDDDDKKAKYQEMFAIYNMWFKKECRTLDDLCRHQLYQISPRGQVPIFAMQNRVPEPLRDYVTFETYQL